MGYRPHSTKDLDEARVVIVGSLLESQKEPIAPTVHMNGTSKKQLIDMHDAAYDAIQDARKVMMKAVPNARDYYVAGHGVYDQARQQFVDQVKKLDSVLEYLESIIGAVLKQGG